MMKLQTGYIGQPLFSTAVIEEWNHSDHKWSELRRIDPEKFNQTPHVTVHQFPKSRTTSNINFKYMPPKGLCLFQVLGSFVGLPPLFAHVFLRCFADWIKGEIFPFHVCILFQSTNDRACAPKHGPLWKWHIQNRWRYISADQAMTGH